MKQLLLSSLFLYILSFQLDAQIVNVPDPNFLNELIDEGVDTNGDGMIQESEAAVVESLYMPSEDISSLEGIEAFVELRSLRFTWNEVTELDLSNNPKITILECGQNNLTTLDLSNLINLDYLTCSGNNISTLIINENAPLEYLICTGNNLETLDVTHWPDLWYLSCDSNNLTELDLSNLPSLVSLHCSFNNITSLDLSNLISLEAVSAFGNGLNSIKFGNLPSLKEVLLADNNLSTLDVSSYPTIEILDCGENNLTNLTLGNQNSNPSKLWRVDCDNNQLTDINLNGLPDLWQLDCSTNPITKLSVSGNLERLIANETPLICLDVSQNPDLDHLVIRRCQYLKNLKYNSNPTILAEDTFLELVCGPSSAWNQFNDPSHENTTFVETCGNLVCKEHYRLSGNISFEYNNCELSNDFDFTNLSFEISSIQDTLLYTSNQSNKFNLYHLPDTLTLSPKFLNPELFETDPLSYSLTLEEDIDGLDFCVTPTENLKSDVSISMYSIESPRPGFEHHYSISYANLGNVISNGTIDLEFDINKMNFVSSNENWIKDNNKLTLDYSDLLFFESRNSTLVFTINTPMDTNPINGGEEISTAIKITPLENDCNRSNNFGFLNEIVVNAYDPNDKTCLQGEYVIFDSLSNALTYRIRFENTGTADAINVTLTDSIDFNVYNINTTKLLGASHDVQMKISTQVLEFYFQDINLPFQDDQNDGWVIFKIEPLPGVPLESSFENNADIFFDFNWPIRTNTTQTILVEDLDNDGFHHLEDCDDADEDINPDAIEIPDNGIDDNCDGIDSTSGTHELNGNLISIFPNPTKDQLNIVIEGHRNVNIEIFNLNGRKMLQQKMTPLDLANFSNGIYLLKVIDLDTNNFILETIMIDK